MTAIFRTGTILLALASGMIPGVQSAQAQDGIATMLDQPIEGNSDDIQRFCSNIADAARERRYAIQKEELEGLRTEVEDRIAAMEKKRAELEEWMRKREEFAKAANEGLVEVYSQMRADAAAERMEELPSNLTAALLTKLAPRTAGTILNEMSPERAATVTVIMSAAADKELTN